MLSDEETSSEGRRRMPRTNARAWPKVEPCEQEVGNHLEHWQDASRDQWHSPGYSNPLPLPHNPPLPHSYHPQLVDNHPPHYHPHLDTFSNDFYHIVQPDQSSHWISLAQYNGNPEQIGHMTRKASTRSAWAEPPSERRGAKPTIAEVSKQELWVDGPTAFRKNIEGLTSNLKKEQLSPAKRQHRHHSNGERSDKPKNHHHRTPSRKHRDTTKHCHQCGADIKKETKADVTQKAEGSKSAGKPSPKSAQELNVIVKPFVKDWVMRHSKNNTPTKESEAMDQHMEGIPADLQSKANDLYETELDEQDGMQLTVELGLYTEGETTGTSDHPLTDLSCNYSEDANQDGVQIDDSVSNVTADEKVGFESKDESSYDETSLSEEIVEVCDAACQTEFTDSDSHSLQSNTPLADSELPPSPESVLDTTPVVIARYSHTKDSTEAFLNATLQGSMLRKPDGASDPSLHKELLSPQVEYIDTVPRLHAKCYSNTLPRNAYLSCPGSIAVGAPAVTLNDQSEKETVQTVKLQPYLSSSRQNSVPHDLESSSLSNHSLSPKSATKTSGGRLMAPESPPIKQESKLKKPTLFKQTSGELTQNGDCKLSTSSPDKKSRTSKLPGLRLSSKPKDGKTGGSTPVTPTKKSESSKKEKKSLLQPPSSWKSSHKANSKLSAPSVVSAKSNGSVDMNSSPYRHYVLPKPSYSHSDGCSDNSSCLSHSIAQHKYSVSSGYDSMTLNSAEDVSQTMDIQANMQSTDPWRSSTLRIESSHCEELDKIHQHRHEENKLSQEAMRHVQIQKLLYRQDQLKKEMAEAKSRLMIPAQTWNYELHVALQVDRRNDDGYLEALEKETSILQKRVDACKSRIMLVTSIL